MKGTTEVWHSPAVTGEDTDEERGPPRDEWPRSVFMEMSSKIRRRDLHQGDDENYRLW